MSDNFDYQNLVYGFCPKCEWNPDNYLKMGEEFVYCTCCTFKMDKQKYLARFGKKKEGKRSWGYWKIKHNSLHDDEKFEDACRVN